MLIFEGLKTINNYKVETMEGAGAEGQRRLDWKTGQTAIVFMGAGGGGGGAYM